MLNKHWRNYIPHDSLNNVEDSTPNYLSVPIKELGNFVVPVAPHIFVIRQLFLFAKLPSNAWIGFL